MTQIYDIMTNTQNAEKELDKPILITPGIAKEMSDYVDAFKLKFKLKYGITPYVSISTKGHYNGKLCLQELLDIVNKVFEDTVNVKYHDGVFSQSRKREVVTYRHAFCKISYSLGYKLKAIAEFINKNHATVLHSIRNVDNLLKSNDFEMTRCMDELYVEIEKYITKKEYEKILQ